MRQLCATIVLMTALSAPFDAIAESRVTSTLKSVCGAGDLAPAEVTARAKASGFFAVPKALATILTTPLPNFKDEVAYWRLYDGGIEMVISGYTKFPAAITADAAVCVAVQTPASSTNATDLQAYFGVGEPIKLPSSILFVYREHNGVRTAVDATKGSQFLEALESGETRFATSIDRSENGITMTGVVIFQIKHTQRASKTVPAAIIKPD